MPRQPSSLDLDARISEGVLLDQDSDLPEFDTFTRPEELLYFIPAAAQKRRAADYPEEWQ